MTTSSTEPTAPAQRTWLRRLAALRLKRAEVIYLTALITFAVFAALAHLYAHFGWDVPVALAIQRVPHLLLPMRGVSFFGNRRPRRHRRSLPRLSRRTLAQRYPRRVSLERSLARRRVTLLSQVETAFDLPQRGNHRGNDEGRNAER